MIFLIKVLLKGKDFTKFEKDFKLRTDAVWEKSKLQDYFRLYYKTFLFDRKKKSYFLVSPRDSFIWLFEPWNLGEGAVPYEGYSKTGHTVR